MAPRLDFLFNCCHKLFKQVCGANLKTGLFINFMRSFVMFLNLTPMFLVNYEMIEYMENDMDKFIYKCILNWFITMSLLSYWIASIK